MRFFTGSYTADSVGAALGIGELLAGDADDVLAGGPLSFTSTVVRAASPSWITAHPELDVIYAAQETEGTVQAFARTGERSFAPLGAAVAAGAATCHVAVSPDASMLVASCWGDGRVVTMSLDATGAPRHPVIADGAEDPHAAFSVDDSVPEDVLRLFGDAAISLGHTPPAEFKAAESEGAESEGAASEGAERASRTHQTRFLPHGLIATTDMGYDLVRLWRRKPTGGLVLDQQVVFPRGSGPRHTVWHPSGHLYVVTELSHEIFALTPDETGRWHIVGATSLGAGILPTDTAAELTMTRDGAFLHVGVRGTNTIAAVRVAGSGADLRPVALVEAGVNWPRHHVVLRDTLLVAGQLSNDVASLTIDERTGVPGRVRYRAEVPTPTCLLPLP